MYISWVSLFVWCYLSNAASFVLCVFRRAKDHHNLLHSSPVLKKTCIRRAMLDKWFPLVKSDPSGGPPFRIPPLGDGRRADWGYNPGPSDSFTTVRLRAICLFCLCVVVLLLLPLLVIVVVVVRFMHVMIVVVLVVCCVLFFVVDVYTLCRYVPRVFHAVACEFRRGALNHFHKQHQRIDVFETLSANRQIS